MVPHQASDDVTVVSGGREYKIKAGTQVHKWNRNPRPQPETFSKPVSRI